MTSKRNRIPAPLTYLGLAVLIAAAAVLLNTQRSMSAVWYGPYLSAAENVTWGGKFLVNLDEIKAFREMSEEARNGYRFSARAGLEQYIANPIGYAYVIYAAKRIFPWLPDVPALESFHILLHTLLSVLIIALLQGWRRKLLFLLLYALNPIVLYYVTFPYYYFLQAIPSFGLIFLMLTRDRWETPARPWLLSAFVLFCVALALVLLVRSTTVAAILAFFVLAALWVPDRRVLALGAVLFVALVATGHSPSQKNFWHTAYIGVGGYHNSHMQGLSDDNGYALFERRTGVSLDASLGGNYYNEKVMAQYTEVAREEYLAILRTDWPSLTRNAVLNVLQGFTIGYLVGKPYWVHFGMATLGMAMLALLLASRQPLVVLLIMITSLPFTPYFPPIPAYLYGAYALLVFGILGLAGARFPMRRLRISPPSQVST